MINNRRRDTIVKQNMRKRGNSEHERQNSIFMTEQLLHNRATGNTGEGKLYHSILV